MASVSAELQQINVVKVAVGYAVRRVAFVLTRCSTCWLPRSIDASLQRMKY